MVIDDEPINTTVISKMLATADYDVDIFNEPEKAWHTLQQIPEDYRLVITDRIMPKLDGLSLTKHIKENTLTKHLPVLMQTGDADKTEHIEAFQAGVFDFIFKPVEKPLLLSIVKRALDLDLSE